MKKFQMIATTESGTVKMLGKPTPYIDDLRKQIKQMSEEESINLDVLIADPADKTKLPPYICASIVRIDTHRVMKTQRFVGPTLLRQKADAKRQSIALREAAK